MKFFITGERGFIARNLRTVLTARGHDVFSSQNNPATSRMAKVHLDPNLPLGEREPCIHKNSAGDWAKLFELEQIEVVIHNAAVVGTDVVALHPTEAVLSNVQGTHHIVKACEIAKVPVCYMGTSVVYRVERYQDTEIDESSEILPKTFYGVLKNASDQIVSTSRTDASIVRPLFAYGGVGDMNSLIAKMLFSSWDKREKLPMFLDPGKIKDYIHVVDFCEAVALVCERKLWNEDLIVSAQSPMSIRDVVEVVRKHCNPDWPLEKFLTWHPEMDYSGNHRLSSSKFRALTGWSPRISLERGVELAAWDIRGDVLSLDRSDYDPMKNLTRAEARGLNLKEHF